MTQCSTTHILLNGRVSESRTKQCSKSYLWVRARLILSIIHLGACLRNSLARRSGVGSPERHFLGLRVFLVGVLTGESAVKSITSVEPAEAAEPVFTRLRTLFTGVVNNSMSSSAFRFLLVVDRVLPGVLALYGRRCEGEELVIV